MMRISVLLVLLLVSGVWPDDGGKAGRRGNALYEEQRFDAAAAAYRAGLTGEGLAAEVVYGLRNNLGAALLQTGDARAARGEFEAAAAAARSNEDYIRSTYNAGNASVGAGDLEAALEHYRKALLADPDNAAAKFNYEFVKRRLQQQQEQEQQQQQSRDGEGDGQQQQQQQQDQQGESGEQDDEEQDRQEQQGDQQQGQGEEDQQQQQQQGGASDAESGEQERQQGAQRPQGALSPEQAERMLQALQNEEEQLLRQVQRPQAQGRHVEKDW